MRLAVIVCASLVCFAQSARAQSPQVPQGQYGAPARDTTQPQPDERGTNKQPLAVKLLNTGKSDQEAAAEAAHIKNEEQTESWTIGLTIAAVGVGGLQLIAFVLQALYMRSTVKEMRRANHTAEVANANATEAILASDRPWIGLRNVKVKDFEAGERMVVEVAVNNSGKSPGLQMRGGFIGRILETGAAGPSPEKILEKVTELLTLMPNGDYYYFPFANHGPLDQSTIDRIKNGNLTVWVSGMLEYLDSAGRTHRTSAQLTYRPRTHGFGTTPTHNDAN